jgi:hypothetical protein
MGDGFSIGDIGWSENDGTGVFDQRQVISSVAAAGDATVTDLDADGDPDVVVAWTGADRVSWYENLGGANFGDPLTNEKLIAGGLMGVRAVDAGDVDGDGDLDLLAASPGDATVRWLKNDGTPADGGWIQDIVVGVGSGRDAVSNDVDNDGDLDVMAIGDMGPLAWYENDGGLWTEKVINASVLGATSLTLVDVNKDGRNDVVFTRCGTPGVDVENRVSWHRNIIGDAGADADGFLGEGWLATGLACPESVVAADITQNGLQDLIVSNSDPGGSLPFTVVMRRFPAHWLFTEPYVLEGTSAGMAAVVGDGDDDGDPDVYAGLHNSVSFSENRTMHYLAEFFWGGVANGGFNKLMSTTPPELNEIAATDLDRDGRTDLITGSGTLGELRILQGLPFDESVTATVASGVTGLEDMITADLDRDGLEDIVTADSDLSWLRTLGGNPVSFETERVIHGLSFQSVAAADLDRDGDTDLVAGGTSGGTTPLLFWFENDGTPLDGGWTAHDLSASLPLDPLTGVGFWRVLAVTTADLDRDGDPDIIAGAGSNCGDNNLGLQNQMDHCGTSSVVWFAHGGGSGTPTYTAQAAVPVQDGLQSVLVKAHLEEFYRQFGLFQFVDDGAPDLLVGGNNPFAFYQNQLDNPGAPQWPEQTLFINGFVSETLVVEDFALDGEDDVSFIISTTLGGGFEGVGVCGQGTWFGCGSISTGVASSPTVDPGIVVAPRDFIAPDLDGDGDADWAIAANNYLWTWRNTRQHALFIPVSPSPGFADQISDTQLAYENELVVVKAVWVRLGAIPGDSSAIMETFSVQFTDDSLVPGPATDFLPGVPLTSAQANAIIEELLVFRDNGDAVFDPATDTQILQVPDLDLDPLWGIQSLPFNRNEPNLKLAAPVRFWIVARIDPGPPERLLLRAGVQGRHHRHVAAHRERERQRLGGRADPGGDRRRRVRRSARPDAGRRRVRHRSGQLHLPRGRADRQ